MVFSSLPLYLDPPSWQQQQQQQQQQHEINQNGNPRQMDDGSSRRGGGSSSMSEKARMAKIPAPEGPLNCPRCDSTNTKFCYFNNYSLTQPRYFCKSCRRYWTRGGALRNVPVGGGCRRNKRRKRAKSPAKPQELSSSELPQPPPDQHLETAAAPFSFLQSMTSSLGLGFGGFGAGLTEPMTSGTSYHPLLWHHQLVNGGGAEMEKVKMDEMRSRAAQLGAGQLRQSAVTENVTQFWGANFNNSVIGSANGGLWN